jgi:hypothetical protein
MPSTITVLCWRYRAPSYRSVSSVGVHMDAMGLMTRTARASVTAAVAAVVVLALFLTPYSVDAQQQSAKAPSASATGLTDSAPEVAAPREVGGWLRLVDQGQYESSLSGYFIRPA